MSERITGGFKTTVFYEQDEDFYRFVVDFDEGPSYGFDENSPIYPLYQQFVAFMEGTE